MKKIFVFTLILLWSCSYTQIAESGFFTDNDPKPITDEEVFLPSINYSNDKFIVKNLLQDWVDAGEYSCPKIWRPKDYKEWERRRFRGEMRFYENGEYEKLILSPNDAHYFKKYRWRLLKNNPEFLISYNEKGERISKMKIEKLDTITLIFYK